MKQHATAAISILIVLLIQNTAAEHATPNRLQRIGNAARFALPDHATHAPPLAACKRLLSAYTAPASIAKPPPELPEDLQPAFTLNGTIPVAKYFVDDTYGGEGSHYSFPQAQIQQLIDRLRDQLAQRWPEIHPDQPLPELLKNRGPALPNSKTPPRQTPEQQHKDRYVLAATKYLTHLQGAKTLVFGSTEPWFEALLLAAGASHVTTLEYNRLTYDHPDITTLRPQEFQSSLQEFDVAVSASSFDHDGLGRYGDRLSADADIQAMRLTKCLLKAGGLLLFSVPVGPDVIVYNLHRRYGRIRLPAMLQGWDILDIVSWDPQRLSQEESYLKSYEPVFVLQRPDKRRTVAVSDSKDEL